MAIENETIAGIKSATMICAFVGSALSLGYAKELTRVQAVTAFITGGAVAVMGTPLVLHYLSLTGELERAVAFFSGLLAMRSVPVAFALVDRLRDIKLPWLNDPKE